MKHEIYVNFNPVDNGFLSYYPLKQGLKLNSYFRKCNSFSEFLSYYPLKQGLKHPFAAVTPVTSPGFLSYYPLKQGLKRGCYERGKWHIGYFYPTIH